MNMRQSIITATAIAVGLAAAIPAMAQTETTETTTTTTVQKGHHRYVYYGDHDIYFAPETKVYYWREGDAWRSGVELPPASRGYITAGGVTIDLDTDRPYERNDWVVEHYRHKRDHDSDDHDHDHDHR
ncbi:MAG: hypothetical protein ACHP7D_00410 [Lysobacterales bacterium]